MFFRTVSGVIPCSRLYAVWRSLRRLVSVIASRIEPVSASAYKMTLPATLRADRPKVWISDLADRRNPSLSASRMATSDTSGRSSPSRRRLIPTRASNLPRRRSRRMLTRSSVSMSECR